MVAFLFAWSVACAVIFFVLVLSDRRLLLNRPLVIVVAVAVIARLIPLLALSEPTGLWGVDIDHYQKVADLVLARSDIYDQRTGFTFFHPYLPFYMYILAASDWVAGFSGLSFFTVVRLPLVAADVGTAALVFLATRELRKDAGIAANAGLAYALCPVPVIVTVYHGQFGVLPVFFAFLAWYLFYISAWENRITGAGAALGMGILVKSWPVLLFPAMLFHLTKRSRVREKLLRFTSVTVAVPAVAVLVYLVSFQASFDALRMRNMGNRGPFHTGYVIILDHLHVFTPRAEDWADWAAAHERLIMYPVLAMVVLLVIPRRGLLVSIVTLLAAALMTSTSGGAHHYVWLVPFALVAGQRMFFVPFIGAAFLSLIVNGFYFGGVHAGWRDVPFGASSLDYMLFIDLIVWSILVLWAFTNMAGSVWARLYYPCADELDGESA